MKIRHRPAIVSAMNYETVAGRLAVSERHVRRLVAQGDLPMVKIGGASRITEADLQAFVASLERSRSTEVAA